MPAAKALAPANELALAEATTLTALGAAGRTKLCEAAPMGGREGTGSAGLGGETRWRARACLLRACIGALLQHGAPLHASGRQQYLTLVWAAPAIEA